MKNYLLEANLSIKQVLILNKSLLPLNYNKNKHSIL